LCQTYQNWEYILVDNCSTDGSSEIAANYAFRFPEKIRLVRTGSFLSQVQNYNFALSCISAHSKYCKMVQADDWLFPDCVRSMVEVGESHPTVGIVAAYQLLGDHVELDGLPYPSHAVPGREIGRRYFLRREYLHGSPTSLLLRCELIRSRRPFYEERRWPLEDAHAFFDLLTTWDYGFVHQVLTFTRRDNESIISHFRRFNFELLARFTLVAAHARDYLCEEEYRDCLRDAELPYFQCLAWSALRGRSREFWEFHRDGLASVNYSLDWRLLGKWIPRAVLGKALETLWNRVGLRALAGT